MNDFKIPFYARAALIFVAAYAFIYALYISQTIIVPIIYATIIAITLNPLVNFLINKKVNKIVAISVAVLLVFVLTACLIYVVSNQVSIFTETYPKLQAKIKTANTQGIQWISQHFNVKIESINTWIQENEDTAFKDIGLAAGRALLSISSSFIVLFLLPVYLFMILYYKPLLISFIHQLFKTKDQSAVVEVLNGTKTIIQSYLGGLMIEAAVIAILNSVGLLILGIDYAIILGITGALLNVIPYIGGVIAIALPMIIAFVSKDTLTYPLLVLGVYLLIQFIDNHFIIPRVVASKVKINALISVIVVIVGGSLWGVAGMFLSIPLTAIMKVVFDHIDILKPWGFLLGNIVPSATKYSFIKAKTRAVSKS